MKKIFTLFSAVLIAATLSAQDTKGYFQFTDKDGNIIADGSSLVVDVPEVDEFGSLLFHSGLYIKNVAAPSGTPVWLVSDITKLDNGALQVCFPTNCISYPRESSNKSAAATIPSGEQKDIQSEWLPQSPTSYGECIVTYTAKPLEKFGKSYIENDGPSVTVRYILHDPAHISQQDATRPAAVATYDLQGREWSNGTRGLRIMRMSDGSVRKVLVP